MDITAFWYNPNIHPYTEYNLRLASLQEFSAREGIQIVVQDIYALDEFLSMASRLGVERCKGCYELRLRKAAEYAAECGFDAFTSTLLYSRYQNHELICEVAENAAREYGVKFHYQDLRIFWQQGIELSKEQEMYRQKYCGCIYSERDRYQKREKK